MITILADDSRHDAGMLIKQAIDMIGHEADYISLADVMVKPCLNCGACNYKSYSKCVFRDDDDWILSKIAKADAVIVVTPILFGGYSVKTKRVLDKLGLVMDRHYFVVKGELAKGGMPGRSFRFYAVGVQDTANKMESEAFCKLIHETLTITRGKGKAGIYIPGQSLRVLEEIAREATSI